LIKLPIQDKIELRENGVGRGLGRNFEKWLTDFSVRSEQFYMKVYSAEWYDGWMEGKILGKDQFKNK
jgi:hypothetical protein